MSAWPDTAVGANRTGIQGVLSAGWRSGCEEDAETVGWDEYEIPTAILNPGSNGGAGISGDLREDAHLTLSIAVEGPQQALNRKSIDGPC